MRNSAKCPPAWNHPCASLRSDSCFITLRSIFVRYHFTLRVFRTSERDWYSLVLIVKNPCKHTLINIIWGNVSRSVESLTQPEIQLFNDKDRRIKRDFANHIDENCQQIDEKQVFNWQRIYGVSWFKVGTGALTKPFEGVLQYLRAFMRLMSPASDFAGL